jgi:CBS domain-containing protein/predicted DCC family thiol-disulfide oxidoreductase YuxK
MNTLTRYRIQYAPLRAAARPMVSSKTRVSVETRVARDIPRAGPRRLGDKAPRSNIGPDGEYDVDNLDVDSLQLDDPFGEVADFMTVNGLRSASPGQPLSSAASKLDKVTGLAVVDADNVVVGVISIKDINRLKKQNVPLSEPCGKHMSKPPIVVREKAKIAEAAALMLSKNIHRLPVVDGAGKLIGIVSRTDIFKPLLNRAEDVYQALSVEQHLKGVDDRKVLQDAIQKTMDEGPDCEVTEGNWVMKYLYDGDCDMCLQLVDTLKGKDAGEGRIKFVNIASLNFNSDDNEGITYEDAMETIHAISRDGTIYTGPDALQKLYSSVGWGWIATLMAFPVVDKVVDVFYKILAKYRIPLSGTLTAMRRVSLTDAGVEHCVDDEEECEAVNW